MSDCGLTSSEKCCSCIMEPNICISTRWCPPSRPTRLVGFL